jgi:uncharacterized DUF497 family protein
MDYEWDENKREGNIAKHGLDFRDGIAMFDGRSVYNYRSVRGEEGRIVTVGLLVGRFVAVVWTERGSAIRLISMRRARDEEKRVYRALFG